MKSVNRYSLIHVSFDGTITPFIIYDEINGRIVKRDKFPLSQLDAFTTRVEGSEGLYLLFNHIYGRRFEDGRFYIQYRQNMKDKRIRVAYSDDVNLKKISNDNIGCIHVKRDNRFENYVISFLYELRSDFGLFKFLSKSEDSYLNSYLLSQIEKYYISLDNNNQDNVDFYFKKICETMCSYKIIRNIEDGRKKYQDEKNIRHSKDSFTGEAYSIDVDGQSRLF